MSPKTKDQRPLIITIFHFLFVRGEEGEGLHELVALGDGYVGVVEAGGVFTVDVEPPVALEDGLVEERGLRAQERLHHQPVVC